MFLDLFIVLICLFLIIKSADYFILGCSRLAIQLNIPLIVVGFFIVGIGTSAPEVFVSIASSINGLNELVIGNALGSNITNITLVLGITALIYPIIVHKKNIGFEMNFLFIFSVLVFFLISDGSISNNDSIIMLLSMCLFLFMSYKKIKKSINIATHEELEKHGIEIPESEITLKKAVIFVLLGLIVLIFSSNYFVISASNIAKFFNVSDLIIGLTIVAIGTSLPELVSCIVAALKKESDLIIGGIIGSNMFNTLVVIAIPGVLNQGLINYEYIFRDFGYVLAVTAILFLYMSNKSFISKGENILIDNKFGALLILLFAAFYYIVLSTI